VTSHTADPRLVVASARAAFAAERRLAEAAIAQIDDEALHRAPAPGANSVAVVVRHVGGNLRSRWTDFLTTDGEKEWRRRDAEFEDERLPRGAVLALWDEGFTACLDTLDALTDADLARTVTIRSEPHSVVQAIHRSLAHTSYHVGQIVLLARALAGDSWKTLSVPRGGSTEFNRRMGHRT
jgi:uncharacterized damage-inducible protein DinB